jgi:hypothetical protein
VINDGIEYSFNMKTPKEILCQLMHVG